MTTQTSFTPLPHQTRPADAERYWALLGPRSSGRSVAAALEALAVADRVTDASVAILVPFGTARAMLSHLAAIRPGGQVITSLRRFLAKNLTVRVIERVDQLRGLRVDALIIDNGDHFLAGTFGSITAAAPTLLTAEGTVMVTAEPEAGLWLRGFMPDLTVTNLQRREP